MLTKIVHLSDLHLGVNGKGKLAVPISLEGMVFEQICGEKPDAIIISGDLSRFGAEEDFEVVSAFLKELEKRFPVLCIPGNTDYTYYIYRETSQEERKEEQDEEKKKQLELEKIELFDKQLLFLGDTGNRFRRLDTAFKLNGKYYLLVEDVLEKKERHYSRLENYKKYAGEEEPGLSINGINFIGFNSSKDIGIKIVARAIIKDSDRKFFLEEQRDGTLLQEHLEERLKNLPSGRNIAVMHHPIFFIPCANEVYGEFANGEETARHLLEKDIQLALCGHKHLPGFVDQLIGEKKFYVCAANTLFSKDIKKPYNENSYNIILIDGDAVAVGYREIGSHKVEKIAAFILD